MFWDKIPTRLKPWLITILTAWLSMLLPWSVNASDIDKNQIRNIGDNKYPQRIIALAPHVVEQLHDIGAYSLLVATVEHADHPSKAKQLPRVGNYAKLNIEKILLLQPDLVIAWHSQGLANDLQTLSEYGINVVYSNPRTLSDISKELRWLGELTGYQQQANVRANAFDAKLEQIKKRYQHKPPIRVFYELWPQPLTTIAGNAWSQQQLTICGAENPFAQLDSDYPQISLENVVKANPQVIIQPLSSGQNVNSQTLSNQTDWQPFAVIDAVRHQQIVRPNSDRLHRMSVRLLDELALLCQQLDTARGFYQSRRVR
ncbi:cobalamin-binding protein [Thalassotalea maritima]|uniref:cobalamin-binding protein n=1 Tax=Thalassotalea maritima TaxID=3242416 RepID=UPI0035274905